MKGVAKSSLEGYQEYFKIDLVNNKRELVLVNVLSVLLVLLMLIPLYLHFGNAREAIRKFFFDYPFLQSLLFCLSMFAYIAAHEAVHGITMRFFTEEKLRYGWKVAYAYAGSLEGLFSVGEYITVALAPLVVFFIVFHLLGILFPTLWTFFYLLQIINVSGAVGDIYVTYRMLFHLKEDILVNDTGTDMMVYRRI